jgi:hypothetical protein
MTSTPISYDVVKVSELELIGRTLNGNDELVVNDLLESPTETKRCRVIDLANSIKQYVLPIASETELGGIVVGDGLTINPTTGVLTTDIVNLGDLGDVSVAGVSEKQILVYDGVEWKNTNADQVFVEMFGGDGIEITGKGTDTEVINVKTGQGITIVNDEVTADLGNGLRIVNDKIEADLGSGLYFENGAISFDVSSPAYITPAGAVSVGYGVGLKLNSGGALEVDSSLVVFKNSQGDLNLSGNLIINGSGLFTGNLTSNGDITCRDLNSLSDANLKDNVKTLEGALADINSIRGVTFNWKRDGSKGAGVIAQEVEKVLPDLVLGSSGKQRAVNYNGLIGVLIEAVKELSKEVEELKNK